MANEDLHIMIIVSCTARSARYQRIKTGNETKKDYNIVEDSFISFAPRNKSVNFLSCTLSKARMHELSCFFFFFGFKQTSHGRHAPERLKYQPALDSFFEVHTSEERSTYAVYYLYL